MTKKTEICEKKECSLKANKCLKAHSPLDWHPTKELYLKHPGKWDLKHREHVCQQENLVFPLSSDDVKKQLSYYLVSKLESELEQHLQFFVPSVGSSGVIHRPAPSATFGSAPSAEPVLSFECCVEECSSPYIDPINEELEQARIEYEEKVRLIKERPRRQLELLQEQEVLKQQIQEMVLKVNDFKQRWNTWFKEGDARLTI
jgi:hypothetical protein